MNNSIFTEDSPWCRILIDPVEHCHRVTPGVNVLHGNGEVLCDRLDNSTAPDNSSLGMVEGERGATLVLDAMMLVETEVSSCIRRR